MNVRRRRRIPGEMPIGFSDLDVRLNDAGRGADASWPAQMSVVAGDLHSAATGGPGDAEAAGEQTSLPRL